MRCPGWCVCCFLAVVMIMASWDAALANEASLEALQKQANDFFVQRQDLEATRKAIERYEKILNQKPGNEKALVRLVRLYVWLGYNQSENLELYQKAAKLAEEAVKLYPNKPATRYWLGAVYGIVAGAPGTSTIKSLALLEPIETQMKRLIELDPQYEYGGAWRVLGRMNTKLPMLLGGDKELAEEYLRKAVKMGPNYYLNHLYLADALNRQERRKEAVSLLQQVMTGKPLAGFEPETRLWQQVAQKALSDLHKDGKGSKNYPFTKTETR